MLTITPGDYDGPVEVKEQLGLADTIGFVDSVASTVFDADTGEYQPALFDFAFDAMLLLFFTDIVLSEDAEEKFALVCHTNLCFEVKQCIDTEYLDGLRFAVTQKIDHLLRCAENALTAKMNDLLASFAQLQEATQSVFANVGGADLKALVDNFAGIDEATLAKAVLAQQENADA